MKVILLEIINNLGVIGDLVNVKAGYARNFLVPKGKAMLATEKNKQLFKEHSTALKIKLEKNLNKAKKRAQEIRSLEHIIIKVKVGIGGKLFGSINNRDIASAINTAGIKVEKNEISMPNKSLRTLGHHEVRIQLHPAVSEKLIVIIQSEI